jgi:PAS domain S-box-containing protein
MLVGLAWRQRPVPGATPFAIMLFGIVFWIGTELAKVYTNSFGVVILWEKLRWCGAVLVPLTWLVFTLEYTGNETYVSRSAVGLLGAPLIVTIVSIFVDHPLMIREWTRRQASLTTVEGVYGPWFEVTLLYSYLLIVVGALLLVRLALSERSLYRWQATALLLAAGVPTVGNVLYLSGTLELLLGTQPALDPTPFLLLISGIGGTTALRRFKLLESLPVTGRIARDVVVDRMDDGVLVVDADGVVVDTNPQGAAMFDHTREQLVGREIFDLLVEDAGIESDERTAFDQDTVAIDDEDGRRFYDVQRTDLRAGPESLGGAVLVFRDVTERRHRQQRLDVLNRVLRHNLRNEMNVVQGYAELLGEDPDEYADKAALIEQVAADLVETGEKARTIERILDETGDPGRIDLQPALVNQCGRVTDAYPMVSLDLDCPEEPLYCDASVEAIVANLLENAAEHNVGPTQFVQVRVSVPEPGTISIAVRDDGPGLPDQERVVFEAGEETPLSHSSGLGLWLVSWGVRQLGGTVSVAENDPIGTVVTVTVPGQRTSSEDGETTSVTEETQSDEGRTELATPRS